MFRIRNRWFVFLTLMAVTAVGSGCGTDLARLLRPTVLVTIRNQTSFVAVPEVIHSDSRNVVEDVFDDAEPVTGFGNNDTIAPGQSANILLTCDGSLERIALRKVEFRTDFGLKVGQVDDVFNVRRDIDFDCGETVVYTLRGTILDFDVEVDVDKSSPVTPINLFGPTDDGDSNGGLFGEDNRDIGDILDDLFD